MLIACDWKSCGAIDRHKFTWFISLDGNYRLSQLVKHCDPNDVPLNKGNAYFVNQDLFRNFLECHDRDSSVQVSCKNILSVILTTTEFKDSLCSKLKAVRQQQLVKFKNTVFSGVVAGQCARHNFYLPQSIVNLVKGES